MNKLDEQIKNYYSEQSLDEDKLESILEEGKKFKRARHWQQYSYAAAAIAVIAFGLMIYSFSFTDNELERNVMNGFANTHIMNNPTSSKAQDFQQLQYDLQNLDFSVIPSEGFIKAKFDLKGGCYCSVDNNRAARIVLVDKETGEPCTLFVTKMTDRLASMSEDKIVLDSVDIMTWKDGDRFFAMARTRKT